MDKIITYKNLYIAYLDCRQTKRKSESALAFELNLEKNLQGLLAELQAGTYRPGQSICFVVREPKPREIFAAGFRDRIVHHLLVRELLPAGERQFIHDSYACRPDKGTHRAVARLRDFLRRAGAGRRDLYFLQLDISGFFMNIDKIILLDLAFRLIDKQKKSAIWKNEAAWLAETLIRHDPTKDYRLNSPAEYFRLIPDRKSLFKQPAGRGLPIGNYTSQFFANLYLNELDQYVKRRLRCRAYVRYVDDFILLHNDPAVLKEWMRAIKIFTAARLNLEISERKIRMQAVKKGIDFLGYFVKPDYALARRAVVARFKNKIKAGPVAGSERKFEAMASSYFGHFGHANCRTLEAKYAGLISK